MYVYRSFDSDCDFFSRDRDRYISRGIRRCWIASATLGYSFHVRNIYVWCDSKLTRELPQVSLADFLRIVICYSRLKSKRRVFFVIGGKTFWGCETPPETTGMNSRISGFVRKKHNWFQSNLLEKFLCHKRWIAWFFNKQKKKIYKVEPPYSFPQWFKKMQNFREIIWKKNVSHETKIKLTFCQAFRKNIFKFICLFVVVP